jgi:hypothetical protein
MSKIKIFFRVGDFDRKNKNKKAFRQRKKLKKEQERKVKKYINELRNMPVRLNDLRFLLYNMGGWSSKEYYIYNHAMGDYNGSYNNRLVKYNELYYSIFNHSNTFFSMVFVLPCCNQDKFPYSVGPGTTTYIASHGNLFTDNQLEIKKIIEEYGIPEIYKNSKIICITSPRHLMIRANILITDEIVGLIDFLIKPGVLI